MVSSSSRTKIFAVADLPGAGGAPDCLDDERQLGVVDRDLDLRLRHEVDLVLRAPVDLGVALLAAVPLRVGDGHASSRRRWRAPRGRRPHGSASRSRSRTSSAPPGAAQEPGLRAGCCSVAGQVFRLGAPRCRMGGADRNPRCPTTKRLAERCQRFGRAAAEQGSALPGDRAGCRRTGHRVVVRMGADVQIAADAAGRSRDRAARRAQPRRVLHHQR